MKRKPADPPPMKDGDYLLASVVDDRETGNREAMLEISQLTIDGRPVASLERVLHFDEFDEVLTELGYQRTEPWGRRGGVRSARVQRS